MISIIVLVYNRPDLTQQTLDSLHASLRDYRGDYEVICIDNGSAHPTRQILDQYEFHYLYRFPKNVKIGKGKNYGVAKSHGDWMYISDNDIYFYPGWLTKLQSTAILFPEAKILGAFRHPHHGLTKTHTRSDIHFEQSDQQVGSSWFLSRETWDQFGPLKEGVSYGMDDTNFCNRITQSGAWVGSVFPYVAYHCGATNSDGEWSPGGQAYLLKSHPPGILVK